MSEEDGCSGRLTKFDFYGRKIGVHLNGENSYKTKLGAVCSFVVCVIILTNALVNGIQFYTGVTQEEKISQIKVDLYDDINEYYLEENLFEISYFLDKPIPDYAGKFKVKLRS